MIAVAQLGFRTCRGSASCGGFCFAHFSFVTQASCGQGQGAHRTRSKRSGARSLPRPARLLRSHHLLLEANVAFRECARRVVGVLGFLALSPTTSYVAPSFWAMPPKCRGVSNIILTATTTKRVSLLQEADSVTEGCIIRAKYAVFGGLEMPDR